MRNRKPKSTRKEKWGLYILISMRYQSYYVHVCFSTCGWYTLCFTWYEFLMMIMNLKINIDLKQNLTFNFRTFNIFLTSFMLLCDRFGIKIQCTTIYDWYLKFRIWNIVWHYVGKVSELFWEVEWVLGKFSELFWEV